MRMHEVNDLHPRTARPQRGRKVALQTRAVAVRTPVRMLRGASHGFFPSRVIVRVPTETKMEAERKVVTDIRSASGANQRLPRRTSGLRTGADWKINAVESPKVRQI